MSAKRAVSIIKAIPGLYGLAEFIYAFYTMLRRRSLRTITFSPPGHFYSPLPDLKALRAAPEPAATGPGDLSGIDLRVDAQLALLEAFRGIGTDSPFSRDPSPDSRYYSDNNYFGDGDGLILYSMLRHFRPRQLVEVGSGFSSALILDVNQRHLDGQVSVTFVEPYSQRLQSLLSSADEHNHRLIETPVQAVAPEVFRGLDANDILFIDSSHVVKTGSDVAHILFAVLPELKPGVVIHFHDILWPFEYPRDWLLSGIAWNEAYFLRAFLMDNPRYEILYYNAFIAECHPAALESISPWPLKSTGGSLWLRKTG